MKNRFAIVLLILLTIIDGLMWWHLTFSAHVRPGDYFLNVGQGDSELVVFESGARLLIDGGFDARVAQELEKILPPDDRYIDLMLNTHPQLDHFGGFIHVLDSFQVGAIVVNGRNDDGKVAQWKVFLDKARAQEIPLVILGAGDVVHAGQSKARILSPNAAFAQSGELNDTGFVLFTENAGMRTLFTADTGMNIESFLMNQGDSIKADVLKVGHHGSKYSSGENFLRAVDPALAIIEVGAGNTYGHPARETLTRIASSTHARILRTDQDGTIGIFKENGTMVLQLHL